MALIKIIWFPFVAAAWLLVWLLAEAERAIGTAGGTVLLGEGVNVDPGRGIRGHTRERGDTAPPSPFAIKWRRPSKRPFHVVTLYGQQHCSMDSGLPVALAPYIDKGAA